MRCTPFPLTDIVFNQKERDMQSKARWTYTDADGNRFTACGNFTRQSAVKVIAKDALRHAVKNGVEVHAWYKPVPEVAIAEIRINISANDLQRENAYTVKRSKNDPETVYGSNMQDALNAYAADQGACLVAFDLVAFDRSEPAKGYGVIRHIVFGGGERIQAVEIKLAVGEAP